MYLSWDGRSFTLAGFIQAFLIRYTSAPVANLVWSSSFLMASLFTVKIFGFNKNLIACLGVFTASLIVLFKSHALETIYWSTGGVYSFNLLLGALWLWIYLNYKSHKIILFITTILLGATTQNLTIALMMIVFSDIIYKRIKSGNWEKDLIVLLILFLPGLIFISLSPGSIHRSQHYSEVSFTFMNLLYKTAVLYFRAFSASIIAIPFAFVTALFFYSKVRESNSFYSFIKYFLASIVSIAPFIILPHELSDSSRIYIYFQFFLFLALVNVFLWLDQILEKRLQSFFPRLYNVVSISTTFAVLVFATTLVWINLKNGIQIQQKVKEREKTIVASPSNSNIIISKIKVPLNSFTFLHAFSDLSDSAEYFANSAAARYYNKNSIITKEGYQEK
jgi:hypothetical protein